MSRSTPVGQIIEGVYWSPSKHQGYASFHIRLKTGDQYEVTVQGLRATPVPPGAASHSKGFAEILGKASIAEVRTDDQTDLAIRMDSGHILMLTNTFDGDTPGNNFYLQSPADAAEWREEFSQMRSVVESV